MFKVPLYQPPTDLNAKNLPNQERIKDLYLCMRVTHAKNDKLKEVKCNPGNKHLYVIPEMHSNAPEKLQIKGTNKADANLAGESINESKARITDGIKVFV